MESKLTNHRRVQSQTIGAYPVQNTFIQYPTLRNPSLEEYIKEREAQSCPASPRRPLFGGLDTPPPPPGQPPLLPGHGVDSMLAEAMYLEKAEERDEQASESGSQGSSSDYIVEEIEQKMKVISLSTGLGIQTTSKGSKTHQNGVCKPCAFFWKDGCKNGPDCQYCHLCPPGELKRRKKARAMLLRRQSRYNDGTFCRPHNDGRPSRTARLGAQDGTYDGYYRRPAGAFGGA